MGWISFGASPCRNKNLMTARVSMLLKSRASLTCFRACFLHGRAKDLSAPQYRTTYNTHNRQTSMPSVGFEPAIPVGEWPQSYALDRAATGTAIWAVNYKNIWKAYKELFSYLSVFCASLFISMHDTYGTRDLKYEQQVDNWGVHRYRQSIWHPLLGTFISPLTLYLLTWRIWWAANDASKGQVGYNSAFKGLNEELNSIYHLLALLGGHHILHFSVIRVKRPV